MEPVTLDQIIARAEKGITNRRWYRIGDSLACVPGKNGSTSFKIAVMPEIKRMRVPDGIAAAFRRGMAKRNAGPYTPAEAHETGLPMYLSIRHPVERFKSLWRDLQRDSAKRLAGIRHWSPQQLLGLIERYPDGNAHWSPQSMNWIAGVICIPYDRFLSFLDLPNEWAHPSVPMECEVDEDRVRAIYADDLRLFDEADRNLLAMAGTEGRTL